LPNRSRTRVQRLAAVSAALFFVAVAGAVPAPVSAGSPPEQKPSQNISDAWDRLLKTTIPQTTPDQALAPAQMTYETKAAGNLLDHFFMNDRTEYMHTQTYFTGLPSVTGVINEPPGPVVNPNGIPFPSAFPSSTNEMYNILNWGTRGWLSDRVNSNFTFAYSQDLTHVTDASPQLSIIDTFNSNRRLELISGYIEINGRPSDGAFSGTTLRLGRQDVYGAELAEMDGASFTVNRPRYSWTIYGGRRYTYFSDPDQRAMGGGNFVFRLGNHSTFEYDTFYYIRGTNTFRYRQLFGNGWLFSTGFRMVGSSPTDFTADAIWSPEDGKTSLHLSFAQKITNKDYFYDYTYDARDFDPHNPLLRLNLGALHPHSQFLIDASRAINERLRLGGTVWVRRLDDIRDVGPFDTSFQDYRGYAQIVPWNRIELLAVYHERDSNDRVTSTPPTPFDDLSSTGETKVQDVSVELSRSFLDGRLVLGAGGYYRILGFRDQFTVISDASDKGVLADASFRVDSKSRLYFDYGLDTDFAVFRPDIQNSQTFRFGVAWSY
jgi:hypothetical protein